MSSRDIFPGTRPEPPHWVFQASLKMRQLQHCCWLSPPSWLKMRTGRTEKIVKRRIKSHHQIILGEPFGTDRERIEPFSEEDRGEDRRFDTSHSGFRSM